MLPRMFLKQLLTSLLSGLTRLLDYWGNYGPLEIWIVGAGRDEVIALDEKWCEVTICKKILLGIKKWDCANGDPYGSGNGWSPFYRYVDEGGAAVSSYIRDYIRILLSTRLSCHAKYPGPEEDDYKKVVLHEYFHVYQHANLSVFQLLIQMVTGELVIAMSTFNGDEVQVPFLMEGGAEYMAQYWYSKEPGIDPGYLKQEMEYKAQTISTYLNDGRSLRELGYNESFQSYDVLTWFVAYLVHTTSEETFRVDFWTQIEDLGFEEAFKSNFGKSADEMIAEFDVWVSQPVEVLLEIIP